MLRASILAVAIGLLGSQSAMAYTTINQDQVIEGTGVGCLAGGVILGATAFIVGPATVGATVAPTSVVPTAVSTPLMGMLGCGAGATLALIMYGRQWVYDLIFTESPYPHLYPTPEDIAVKPNPLAAAAPAAPQVAESVAK